ncbi:ribose-5-phosphate isomerase RpiA [Marinicrinis sediminis]|uniref:Ribose-5-phosphate isomerase A n=1 Tax=Marinicrinis sediminis TaxID=1652465 RepID=A0ABW5R5A6_9BACL
MHAVNTEKEKQRVGEQATALIENDMLIGLGTGSTVYYFLRKLGEKVREGLQVMGVATSRQTQTLAESFGIPLVDFNAVNELDLTVDGADEANYQLQAIKGGGGALLSEKLVASRSKRVVWIMDATKLVRQLGNVALPVEVIPFGYAHTMGLLQKEGWEPVLRQDKGSIYTTDHGHYILDVPMNGIHDPHALSVWLHLLPGVVEHGLFLDFADTMYVADGDQVVVMHSHAK